MPSSQPMPVDAAVGSATLAPLRQWLGVYLELGKARLSALVVVTAAVGYILGSGPLINWPGLSWLIVGTALAALGANALNQVWEMQRDSRMPRTRQRPLPSGRIGRHHATLIAILSAGFGSTVVAAMTNLLAGALCLSTILVYVLAYTPLKPRTTLNTLVGGVVGALPPMMGWAAAAGQLDPGAWVIGAVLFVWQIPHFLALAWLYRRDYELGGYRMLPLIDPTGAITGRTVLLWSLALVPVTLTATLLGVTGWLYAAGAMALGVSITAAALRLHRSRQQQDARHVFIASIIYLPLLMGLMVLDRAGPSGHPAMADQDATPIHFVETLDERLASSGDVSTDQPVTPLAIQP